MVVVVILSVYYTRNILDYIDIESNNLSFLLHFKDENYDKTIERWMKKYISEI